MGELLSSLEALIPNVLPPGSPPCGQKESLSEISKDFHPFQLARNLVLLPTSCLSSLPVLEGVERDRSRSGGRVHVGGSLKVDLELWPVLPAAFYPTIPQELRVSI